MKRIKTRKVLAGVSGRVVELDKAPVAASNVPRRPSRKCPVCKSTRPAEVEVTIGFITVYVCGRCADVPLKAMGLLEALRRFL